MMALAEDKASVAARFVEEFGRGWGGPDPDRLLSLLRDDVRLRQPMFPETTGHAAARATFFKPLLRFFPDFRIEVARWSASGDTLFIEWTARTNLAGRPLSWSGVDRFRLVGDKAVERVAYFDGLPLVVAILRSPSRWLAFLRSGLARSWRVLLARPVPTS